MGRFKKLCLAALVVFGIQIITQFTIDGSTQVKIDENELMFGNYLFVDAAKKEDEGQEQVQYKCDKTKGHLCTWADKEMEFYYSYQSQNGYVEEWDVGQADGGQLCVSWALIPGTSLINKRTLGVAYLICLCYLFFGIAIISDIFMESIEQITSENTLLELLDKDGNVVFHEVPKWNATVANLTLMALGSSAPEILLSLIGTLQDLEAEPPELGPSTIVGSAAFNLLVITGLSIMAVDEEPKKVYDLGVFAVTSLSSIWAYIWLFIVLSVSSPGYVSLSEGWWTLIYFFMLILFAYTADRVYACINDKKKSFDEVEERERQVEQNIKKNQLRRIAKQIGESLLIEIAQGVVTKETNEVSSSQKMEIITLYKVLLNSEDLGSKDINELLQVLQPDSLLERFAFRKKAGLATNKDFLKMKGNKGQLQNVISTKSDFQNELLGFKCLHYSVTENNGNVELTIIKKIPNQVITFGYRTIEDTAKCPKDFEHVDVVITMQKREIEKKIYIPIIDDNEWEPDLDFFVELYDPNKINNETGLPEKLNGDDTKCMITILDDDFPGSLGFAETDLRISKKAEQVDITIVRLEGADGTISCMVRTEPLSETPNPANAEEYEDYVPKYEKIVFQQGETEKVISIKLVKEKSTQIQAKLIGGSDQKLKEEGSSEEEECDVIFKLKLEKPEPSEVKISKKNVALVTILKGEEDENYEDDRQKLYEYYMQSRRPSWSQQFKDACMLGPQIDEDSLILEGVSGSDAAYHFLTIFWKVLFAIVPPPTYWNGKAAFVVSLTMIGLVTAIVGEIAAVLGCVLGITQSVTAITLVALGTSLPDTFASMTAARQSKYADSAIGNVTGSNSVNVFLGLGLPWALATTYWSSKGLIDGKVQQYKVPAGAVAFSVFVFLITAAICFLILIGRRVVIGGELGGPQQSRIASCFVCISLWCIYIVLSILNAQGIIQMKP